MYNIHFLVKLKNNKIVSWVLSLCFIHQVFFISCTFTCIMCALCFSTLRLWLFHVNKSETHFFSRFKDFFPKKKYLKRKVKWYKWQKSEYSMPLCRLKLNLKKLFKTVLFDWDGNVLLHLYFNLVCGTECTAQTRERQATSTLLTTHRNNIYARQ